MTHTRHKKSKKQSSPLPNSSLHIGQSKRHISHNFSMNACSMVLIQEIAIPEALLQVFCGSRSILCHQLCIQFNPNSNSPNHFRNMSNVMCLKVDLEGRRLVHDGAHSSFIYVPNCDRKCRLVLVLFTREMLEGWKTFPSSTNDLLDKFNVFQVLFCDFFPCPLLRTDKKEIKFSVISCNLPNSELSKPNFTCTPVNL